MGDDQQLSLLWISVPAVIALLAFFARKWYLAKRLQKHGIGKGAPGFQTSVKRIRVTPEIAARIRRGEEVSSEEIAAAAAQMEKEEAQNIPGESQAPPIPGPANEWLPDHISTPRKRAKGKKR